MSALGQKQTSEHDWIMSALPPKADMELSRVISALCQKRTSSDPFEQFVAETNLAGPPRGELWMGLRNSLVQIGHF
jgi:hypothetical protein